MPKTKMLVVRLTEEQNQLLQAMAKANGFSRKSDFLRWKLFIAKQEGQDGRRL